MGWIATAYHFVSAIVMCGIQNSAEIAKTALDMGVCISGKLFQ